MPLTVKILRWLCTRLAHPSHHPLNQFWKSSFRSVAILCDQNAGARCQQCWCRLTSATVLGLTARRFWCLQRSWDHFPWTLRKVCTQEGTGTCMIVSGRQAWVGCSLGPLQLCAVPIKSSTLICAKSTSPKQRLPLGHFANSWRRMNKVHGEEDKYPESITRSSESSAS